MAIAAEPGAAPKARPAKWVRARRWALCLLLAVAAVPAYLLLWGRWFPYCPVTPGFTTHELASIVVCVQDGTQFDRYEEVDALASIVETCHGMRFIGKPRLVVFGDDASYRRLSPSRARFCAFYNGTIVMSPRALREVDEGSVSLTTYLRHELSHVLIFQQMGVLRSLHYPKWLLEGIATYAADQRGTDAYPSKEETYRLIREGNFMPPTVYQTKAGDDLEPNVENPLPFIYSEFACLVEYLIDSRGEARFWEYVRALMGDSDQDRAFCGVYGTDLEAVVEEFREHVQGQREG
jgi:hypothetical protein